MKDSERMQLSEHFKLFEFTRSGVALDRNLNNTPNDEQIEAMRALCQNILEPLRRQYGPIVISSGFRSKTINRLVGGSPTSQHLSGEAADIVVSSPERANAIYAFISRNLDFDQLIFEPIYSPKPRWIHVSYTTKRPNRHEKW
ncbi:MAG: D-Ala-D-Ala carboxypeptidase family metallohydrolase [Prevotella sp.]|nr:D-Ala-D-Ala carboxypeptidase family metallohydrolase [Prevotella sp.]